MMLTGREGSAPERIGDREVPSRRGWPSRPAVRWILGAVLFATTVLPAITPMQKVGLFVNDERASQGLTLFGPKNNSPVYLINNDGLVVRSWETFVNPASMPYLLPNGNILRAAKRQGGASGVKIQEFDWDGNVVWEYTLTVSPYNQHHDIEPLPNGNVLVLAREIMTQDKVVAAGRNPLAIPDGEVRPDAVIEIRPIPPNDGEIVWEWRVWDHLVQDFDPTKDNYGVVEDHPELIDINYGPTESDWTHANSIAYNAQLDQIVISSRKFNELWVIDHSTTTEEAAGHTGGNSGKGGDLLYRWGNPAAYRRGTADDQKLFGQHDAQWIPPGYPGEGNILVFNNGWFRPSGEYSTVEEIVPPVDEFGVYSRAPDVAFGPDEPVWSYQSNPPSDFYSANISGAQRLPDGTTLICEGIKGHLFEVTVDGEVVWEYVNPVDSGGPLAQGDPVSADIAVVKTRRYPLGHPAFAGRDLTPGDPIELFNSPLPVEESSLAVSGRSGSGDEVQLEWDASTCTSFDYHLLFGPLTGVSTYELSGADCNIGTSGTHVWTNASSESLYFLIVGTDDLGVYESSWGRDSAGDLRNGTAASFQCDTTTKVVSGTCP
jgi:hypothetical protein